LAPPLPLATCHRATIESALAAPGIGWGPEEKHPDLPAKAAALLYSLAKSQACSDGNKRVALLLTSAFVRMNGSSLKASHAESVAVILHAAESEAVDHDAVVVEITDWMRTHLSESKAKS
jgi:prophage maintenance system killer protein